jgi:hypothetical protein
MKKITINQLLAVTEQCPEKTVLLTGARVISGPGRHLSPVVEGHIKGICNWVAVAPFSVVSDCINNSFFNPPLVNYTNGRPAGTIKYYPVFPTELRHDGWLAAFLDPFVLWFIHDNKEVIRKMAQESDLSAIFKNHIRR